MKISINLNALGIPLSIGLLLMLIGYSLNKAGLCMPHGDFLFTIGFWIAIPIAIIILILFTLVFISMAVNRDI